MALKSSKFSDVCDSLNLTSNPRKTRSLVFNRSPRRRINLRVNGQEICQVNSFKYLGMAINRNIYLREHYERVKSESVPSMNLIKKLTTIKGGLRPDVGIKLYKSYSKGKIEYAKSNELPPELRAIKLAAKELLKIALFKSTIF